MLLDSEIIKSLGVYFGALLFGVVVVADIFRPGYHPSAELLGGILIFVAIMIGSEIDTGIISINPGDSGDDDE